MYEKFLSERLAQLRAQKGVSARDMSLSLGQSESYINTIENKKSLPSMTMFFYICEYLEITPKEFFDIDNSHPQLMGKLIDELKRLDDKTITHILGLLQNLRSK